VAAAIEAGKVVHDIYRGGFDVQHKADASPVTDADNAAEAIILKRLRGDRSSYPDYRGGGSCRGAYTGRWYRVLPG